MGSWNACASEPNFVLQWIECHPSTGFYLQSALLAVALLLIIILLSKNRALATGGSHTVLPSVRAVAAEIHACLSNAAKHFAGDKDKVNEFVRGVDAYHRFRIASAALARIPLHELPTYESARAVMILQRLMSEGQKQIDAAFQEITMLGHIQHAEKFTQIFSHLDDRAKQEVDVLYDA